MRARRGQPVWTDRDALVVVAFEIYEGSLCDRCGQHKNRSLHPEMSGEYDVIELQCMGCEALESHHKGKDEFDHSIKEYLIDVGPPDRELPTWRPNFAAAKRKDDRPDA